MIEFLDKTDIAFTLFLNGFHNPWMDKVMLFLTDQRTWYPLYAVILGFLGYWQRKTFIFSVLLIVLLITFADQTSSGFLKPTVGRLRPCHNPEITQMVHNPGGCGGTHGFTSSHASNHFAVAFFLFPLLRLKWKWAWLLFPWAAIIAYSRVYLGVHFFGDIFVGSLIGTFYGWILYQVGEKVSNHYDWDFTPGKEKYTS